MRAADGVIADSALSANLYCEGHLDAILAEVIVPFLASAKTRAPGAVAMWLMRYSRRGEHLKIRVQAPKEVHEELRSELEKTTAVFFESLPLRDPDLPRINSERISPIDAEDSGTALYPDRSLLWTDYEYPPRHMGLEPLSGEAGFARTFINALSSASEIVLAQIEAAEGEALSSGQRLSLMASVLIAGIGTLPWAAGDISAAFAYQRDWLLGGAPSASDQALEFMDRRAAGSPAQVSSLGQRLEAAMAREPLAGLQDFARTMAEHLDFLLGCLGADSWAEVEAAEKVQVRAATARILHNVANLLQVDISNEIYLCHLLVRASASPSGSLQATDEMIHNRA